MSLTEVDDTHAPMDSRVAGDPRTENRVTDLLRPAYELAIDRGPYESVTGVRQSMFNVQP